MAGKVLPLARWPAADRAAWTTALSKEDPFDERGAGAHWSEGSRRSVASGYGRWVGYLAAHEPHALGLDPAARLAPDRIARFMAHLRAEITPAGVHIYVKHTYDAIRIMSPARDWSWLRTAVWRLARGVRPHDKRSRVVHARRLYRLGLTLMRTAESPPASPLQRAIAYRDGLLIALLAVIPLRRRNIAGTALTTNLVRVGDGHQIAFDAAETKTKRPLAYVLPPQLVPWLTRYITDMRPCFPRANESDALWLSAKGGPLGAPGLYEAICKRTRRAFGYAINPHLFRDIAVTTIALEAPDQIGRARDLLGHGSLDVLERHYNQARSIEASRLYRRLVANARACTPDTTEPGGR